MVRPRGIEPLLTASEAVVISVSLRAHVKEIGTVPYLVIGVGTVPILIRISDLDRRKFLGPCSMRE